MPRTDRCIIMRVVFVHQPLSLVYLFKIKIKCVRYFAMERWKKRHQMNFSVQTDLSISKIKDLVRVVSMRVCSETSYGFA